MLARVAGALGLFVTFGALGALGPVACTASDDATQADADLVQRTFVPGDYVTMNSPYAWAAADYDESMQAYYSLGARDVGRLVPDGDPLIARVQLWLDRADAVVRAELKKRGVELVAPKPIAKVLADRNFNAWVTPAPACLGVPFGTGEGPELKAVLGASTVEVSSAVRCIRPASWTDPAAFVKAWNDPLPAYKATLADGKLSVAGAGCNVYAPNAADTVGYGAMPYIHVTTSLLGKLSDENAVVVVMAHELGHYYRAHVLPNVNRRLTFWYDEGGVAPKKRLAAADQASLEKAYREVADGVKGVPGPTVPSRYGARLRPYLLDVLGPILQARKEPGFVCAAARDAYGPWAHAFQFGGVGTDEDRKALAAYEAALAACAPKLGLASPGATAVSAGEVLLGARTLQFKKVSMKLGDRLSEFVARLDEEARALDAKADALVARLRQNRVGFYTTEQEADEMAVDLASKLGLTGDDILAGWLDFMRAMEKLYEAQGSMEMFRAHLERTGDKDAATCEALMKAGFTSVDAAGKRAPVFVSIGQLDEPHHGSCYRLYNLWKSIKTQRYAVAPKQPASELSWSSLAAHAAELTPASYGW